MNGVLISFDFRKRVWEIRRRVFFEGLEYDGKGEEMGSRAIRKEMLKKVRRIVVKVGSSILASREMGLHRTVFSQSGERDLEPEAPGISRSF